MFPSRLALLLRVPLFALNHRTVQQVASLEERLLSVHEISSVLVPFNLVEELPSLLPHLFCLCILSTSSHSNLTSLTSDNVLEAKQKQHI